jgi:hypothetical protein
MNYFRPDFRKNSKFGRNFHLQPVFNALGVLWDNLLLATPAKTFAAVQGNGGAFFARCIFIGSLRPTPGGQSSAHRRPGKLMKLHIPECDLVAFGVETDMAFVDPRLHGPR